MLCLSLVCLRGAIHSLATSEGYPRRGVVHGRFIQHVRGTLPGAGNSGFQVLLSLARMMPRPKNREKLCEYYNMGSKECREFLQHCTGLAQPLQPGPMNWATLAFLITFVHTKSNKRLLGQVAALVRPQNKEQLDG